MRNENNVYWEWVIVDFIVGAFNIYCFMNSTNEILGLINLFMAIFMIGLGIVQLEEKD